LQADRRAVVEAARAKLAELDMFLDEARRRRRPPPRIVRKVNPNALVSRRSDLIWR
jgi:hypothetical protein